ncbi:endonuclease [Nocardioides sp. KR10-350]|uniref:endonuclease n=1 Tax=Nocardioides cheoyonin TaxID=3156615 RepID=UPI0032B33852
MTTQKQQVEELLREHGTTYAQDAGITLRDKPAPLYQLLVLTTLASARISADIAVATARELFAAGWRTPEKMAGATWQQRVDALGRGGYRRYDESTSTKLEESARCVMEEYAGDLRRLPHAGPDDLDDLRNAVAGFPRIGPTGADIFVREVQDLWPVGPVFDQRALKAAGRLDLPTDPDRLARLARRGEVAHLAAALVKAA